MSEFNGEKKSHIYILLSTEIVVWWKGNTLNNVPHYVAKSETTLQAQIPVYTVKYDKKINLLKPYCVSYTLKP